MKIYKISKKKLREEESKIHQEILKEIEEKEKQGEDISSYGISERACEIDKMKFNLCQEIILFKRLTQKTSQEVADLMGIDKSRTSEIMHCRVGRFTLDKLVSCFLTLEGHHQVIDKKILEIKNAFLKIA